jgi:hypothetical protein
LKKVLIMDNVGWWKEAGEERQCTH